MFNNIELQKLKEVDEVFHHYDYDGSGAIEVAELHAMFEDNGIFIEHDEL